MLSALLLEKQFPAERLCGVDEVGRGPLAGPVISAALTLPDTQLITKAPVIRDSKAMTERQREQAFEWLSAHCHFAIGICSREEIDTYNILQASLKAMSRAVAALPALPSLALIDGNKVPACLPCKGRPIIKGDAKSWLIAGASVIAKVTRDRIMRELAREFPHYGWDSNAGYSTKAHMEAIEQYGITPHHRLSFAPVKAAQSACR